MIQQQSPTRQRGVEEHGEGRLSQYTEYIASNPSLSVAVGFALGFGTGLALGSLLGGSSYFAREEGFAERIGHRVADSLKDVLPSSWKNPFQS